MPIYRCNQCGFISEVPHTPTQQTPCSRCNTVCTVYGTVFFVEEIIKRLGSATQEIKQLKEAAAAQLAASTPASFPVLNAHASNTAVDASAAIQQWFATRQIDAQFDPALSDTSGFFDETAVKIGDGYTLFGELMERVRYAYRKSHSTVTLELAQLPQKDIKELTQLCRWLYEHTFFARYHYQKTEKIARLTLQTAPAIRQFFEGGWLEWYALMAVQQVSGNGVQPLLASARGVKVVFPNEDLHELDVVCLPTSQIPVCIECKSGEFRRDIDKYLRLRKRLDVPRQRFIILSPELTQEQADGLSAMYELSFVNLHSLTPHLRQLL